MKFAASDMDESEFAELDDNFLDYNGSSSRSSSMASQLDDAASRASKQRVSTQNVIPEQPEIQSTAMRLALGQKEIKKLDFLTKFVREFRYIQHIDLGNNAISN